MMAKCKYVATVELDFEWDSDDPGKTPADGVREIINNGVFESEIKQLLESELISEPCDVCVTRQFADVY